MQTLAEITVPDLSVADLVAVHVARAHAFLDDVRARLEPRAGSTERDLILHDDRLCRALGDLRAALNTLTELRPPCPADAPEYF